MLISYDLFQERLSRDEGITKFKVVAIGAVDYLWFEG
jgi:hypothetical protein